MDLPNDKRQVVMNSTDEKKWQLVRDNTRRIRQNPPREYLSRLRQVKDCNDARKARRRATEPATIQALQGLEISLRTNDIRYFINNRKLIVIPNKGTIVRVRILFVHA